ncbi:MAG TPA: hypothetical protein VFD45_03595 [Patescibacteria group bacterium]|nr:hypothetical protein [Patescibacteria group bacterium]
MKKPITLIILLLLIVLVLSVVRTVVSNGMSTSGSMLSRVSEELDYYKTENASLKEMVYLKASLTNISSEAAKLGFVDQKTSFAISSSLPIAVKQ